MTDSAATAPGAPSPVTASPTPIVSVRPVVLPAPSRGDDLEVRVSAPASGDALAIIVFSHGFGSSMDGYAPLVDFWAARGFAVMQPTHLDSRTLGIPADDPRTPQIWRTRIEDLTRVLDELGRLESAVPGLAGRLDHERIIIAGHSWGATTASALLGARVLGADGTPGEDMSDPRISAGLLLALAGRGGDDLTPFAAEHFPFMSPDFASMTPPALIVAGDHDQSVLSTRGPDWWTDGYRLSPPGKSLLTLFDAEHSLGGITGRSVTETTDESPERVALLQRLSWAWMRSALSPDDENWALAQTALRSGAQPLGEVESR